MEALRSGRLTCIVGGDSNAASTTTPKTTLLVAARRHALYFELSRGSERSQKLAFIR